MADVAALARRLDERVKDRTPHENVWRECFDHSWPLRGSGLQGSDFTAQNALDRKARLMHGIATEAGRTLAAAIVSGATPSSSVWALLKAAGSDDEGGRFLDAAGKAVHEEVHASSYDSYAFECAMDLVGAGWFVLYIDVDREIGGLTFEQWPLAGCFVLSSKPGGRIDTIFRRYTITAEQAVNEFGIDRVSPRVAKQYAAEPDTKVTLCHAIYPRAIHVVEAKLAKNLPFASCHFEVDTRHELRESGYHEFPCVVPRWSLIPGTAYAVGPMMDALPDSRELNDFLRNDRQASAIAVSGMWIAEDDGVLNPRTIKVGAGKVIPANSVDSMKPLIPGSNWQLADARVSQYEAAIRRILMADQLQPQDGPAMTATEVHVRVGMIRQLLGPIYGRLQAEWLAPMVERCFGLMYRAGRFGMAPQSLGGSTLRVRYNNPLARAQKLEDVGAIERLNANVLTLANLGAAGITAANAAADIVDWDENVRAIVDGLGVPLKVSRTPERVQSLRDERAQQQQAAQQQAQQHELGMLAADAATQAAAKRAA